MVVIEPEERDVPTYVVCMTLSIAVDRYPEFESMMAIEAPLTRAFAGCELFEIYAGERPGEIIFLEHWRSQADSQAYTAWRTERGDMARLGAFFTAPPCFKALSRLP